MDVAQTKADVELCCPALPLNLHWHTQTCESQKPALLCPAWAALPASQCAPGLIVTLDASCYWGIDIPPTHMSATWKASSLLSLSYWLKTSGLRVFNKQRTTK